MLVDGLRRQLVKLENGGCGQDEQPVSTGMPDLDRLLPAGGLRRGTLVEYLTGYRGSGAGVLALAAAREACREGRALVVVEQNRSQETGDREQRGRFYPPAAAAWGIDLSRLLVLRPTSDVDAVWALDQALRCGGVGAVWSKCDRFDVRDFRRLQLAAECGGTLGLFIRPARLRGQPTWAEIQWIVNPKGRARVQGPRSKVQGRKASDFELLAWRLSVELIRCRGAAGGKQVLLELDESAGVWREVCDEAAHSVSVFSGLADSTPLRRA
jgi:protein ImuA